MILVVPAVHSMQLHKLWSTSFIHYALLLCVVQSACPSVIWVPLSSNKIAFVYIISTTIEAWPHQIIPELLWMIPQMPEVQRFEHTHTCPTTTHHHSLPGFAVPSWPQLSISSGVFMRKPKLLMLFSFVIYSKQLPLVQTHWSLNWVENTQTTKQLIHLITHPPTQTSSTVAIEWKRVFKQKFCLFSGCFGSLEKNL